MCVFLNCAAELQGTIKSRLHYIILNIDYIDIDYIDHELSWYIHFNKAYINLRKKGFSRVRQRRAKPRDLRWFNWFDKGS